MGSSPTAQTTKAKLRARLRALDRRITEADQWLDPKYHRFAWLSPYTPAKRAALDAQRREVREKLKAWRKP